MSIYFPHALFIQTILTSPYLSYLCFFVSCCTSLLIKFQGASKTFIPHSHQCRWQNAETGNSVCQASPPNSLAKQRINFQHSDLCAVAFRICVRINALLILRVKVFGRFSKNTKSLRAKVMTSPALRLPPELRFIFADWSSSLTTLRCIKPLQIYDP